MNTRKSYPHPPSLNFTHRAIRRAWAIMAAAIVAASAAAALANDAAVLLDDDFSAYRPGLFFVGEGARTEYHYLPAVAPQGNWVVSTFRSDSDSQRAWRIIADGGAAAMRQSSTNKYTHYHPMLLTGDAAWTDYTVEVEFTPESEAARSGFAFRQRNDRCYYFIGVEKGRAVLRL
ncbi:MAG: hypothetical protein WCH75_19390, partial [Candidatus Binatia bacterium]